MNILTKGRKRGRVVSLSALAKAVGSSNGEVGESELEWSTSSFVDKREGRETEEDLGRREWEEMRGEAGED